jgi:hypothetical protein
MNLEAWWFGTKGKGSDVVQVHGPYSKQEAAQFRATYNVENLDITGPAYPAATRQQAVARAQWEFGLRATPEV